MKPSQQWQRQLWIILFLGCVGLLLVGLNMRRGLNHDEHQFIASGALLAREGMLPYGSYPYFHMPTLVIIYAALFQFSERLLLVARLFSISCSWLTIVFLFIHARNRSTLLSQTWQLLWPICCTLLFISGELFIYTSGRAWNHDLPVLLTIGAILACNYALTKGSQKYIWHRLFLVGLLMGLATTARLSFAFTALAVVAVITIERRFRGIIAFGCGSVVGALPAIYLSLHFPSQFIFGNVEYIQLNTQYFLGLSDPPATLTLLGKLSSALSTFLEPANLLLLVLFSMTLWLERSALWTNLKLRLFVVAWVFTLLGAFSPTPSQTQYFYPLMPLMAFTMVELSHHVKLESFHKAGPFIFATLLFSILSRYTMGMEVLTSPDEWYPNRLHTHAQTIANLASEGPTLTLAPLYPLEAGQAIYPALATGPFTWRVSDLVSPSQRVEQNLLSPSGLDAVEQPPRAILTGLDNDEQYIEQPMLDYARQQGYMPIPMPDDGTLWLSSLHKWENVIQIGGHTLPREIIEPGSHHQVTFYLQSIAPISQNLNVVVRVVDAANTEIWRVEGWPWGAATSDWMVGDVWPDGHLLTIAQKTTPGIYRVEMGFYDPQTLDNVGSMATIDYLRIGSVESDKLEALIESPAAQFGRSILLKNAQVNTDLLTVDGSLTVQTVWQAQTRPPKAYTAFIHLVGPDGQLVAQMDQPPFSGFYPTNFWQPNGPLQDSYTLSGLNELAPGEYQLYLGMYDSQTVEPLPIFVEGVPNGNRLMLATVHLDGHRP